MNQTILNHLHEIEKEYNVTILYAVETGSRAWGFHSSDSDWDVRFIYVNKPEWYYTVVPKRDVIEKMYEDNVDASGFELRKALSLFRKTNPTILEWLHSPMVYIDKNGLSQKLIELEPRFFNSTRATYHYYRMAVNHDERYLQKRGVELKRFLYYLRGLIACWWVLENETPPPVPFRDLVLGMIHEESIKKEVEILLDLKSKSREHDKMFVSEKLCEFASHFQSKIEDRISGFKGTKCDVSFDKKLDNLLMEMVLMANK